MPLTLLAPDSLPATFGQTVRSVASDVRVIGISREGPLPAEVSEGEVLYRSSQLRRERVAEILAAAPQLRWVHIPFAGVDGLLAPEFAARGITVTHAVGIFDAPVAEFVLAFILAAAKRFPVFGEAQRAHRWLGVTSWDNASALPHVPALLRDQTMGIVGFGGIGRKLAAMLQPLGARVLGLRRTPAPDPLAAQVLGPGDLSALLGQSDYVVLATPLTDTTRSLIGATEIAAMKPGAWLINIGRGALVDDDALVPALKEGRIGGACLDVFRQEPLPADHPYYDLPNVILTPHITGIFPNRARAEIDLFAAELRRFVSGEPFRGRVDLNRGY